ncbi:MAG: lipopolysaccharide heptosyltransferase II [Desulfobacterales bacterium]|nr:lipopolysaccharide heptosyltransferase II [Desulfobacterales bacterium]
MTTPAVRAIRKNFPHAEISILAKPWVAPVFQNSSRTDHVLLYDGNGKHKGLAGKIKLAKELRKYRFDAAILLQNAFEAALITCLAGIPRRIGYNTDARTLLLTHAVPCTSEIKRIHQTGYYLEILRGAGLHAEGQELELEISEKDCNLAGEILRHNGLSQEDRIVGINPGATYGTAKRWFPERYADVCSRLQETFGVRIAVFGAPGEEGLGEQISKRVGKHCINLCGKTGLGSAMALIGMCSLFITNDSGLMHVAAALDIPQIAIFGPTDHETTSPFSTRSHILKIPASCSPCLKPECPEDHRCMKDITVDMVYNLAESLLRPFL